MPDKHALLSASKASRWLTCTPSARLEETFPDDKSSEYAEEGTLAHEVAYLTAAYRLGQIKEMDFENRLDDCKKHRLFQDEMLTHANDYADFIAARSKGPHAMVALEVQLDYSEYAPEGFGTGDCVILDDETITVIDYKYGKGVPVDANENDQMMLYALGAYIKYGLLYDLSTVSMHIFQPRLNSISSYIITTTELLAWAKYYVKPRAVLAFKGAGEFAPSEKACRFCKAAAQCRARSMQYADLFDEDREPIDLLTPEEIGTILDKAKGLTDWLKALESYVVGSLTSGQTVPGWKLVEGRSNRRFTDELAVAERLRAHDVPEAMIYTRKLVTLTQLEKDLGKKTVAETIGDLIEKPTGAPTLVPVTDKRPEYVPHDQIMKEF